MSAHVEMRHNPQPLTPDSQPLGTRLALTQPGSAGGLRAIPAAIFANAEVAPAVGVGVVTDQLMRWVIGFDQPPGAAGPRRALANLPAHGVAPGQRRAQRALGAA